MAKAKAKPQGDDYASLAASVVYDPGASRCHGCQEPIRTWVREALALLPERPWDVLLVDYPLARAMAENCDLNRLRISRRIIMIRPSERHELPALKNVGFTGYLIKPVRAASLASRLTASDTFEHSANDAATERTEAPSPAVKGLSILVAEDNEINALLARALLTQLGHRPTIAGSRF